MTRISFIEDDPGQFSAQRYFLHQFAKAFSRQGIEVNLISEEKAFHEKNLGDFTFSINGCPFDEENRYLFELNDSAHISYLVDHSYLFYQFLTFPQILPFAVDRSDFDLIEQFGVRPPELSVHAVDSEIAIGESDRPIEIAFFGNIMDHSPILEAWKKLPLPMQELLHLVVEKALADQSRSYIDFFIEESAKQRELWEKQPIFDVLFVIEKVLRTEGRIRLLRAFSHSEVHIFSSSEERWRGHLQGDHYQFHDPLSFDETVAKMQQCKVVLNASPMFPFGAHERLLNGMAAGAIGVTGVNSYLKEHFKDQEDLVFYRFDQLESLEESIHSLLSNETKRRSISEKGREMVMKEHTFDNRVEEMLLILE